MLSVEYAAGLIDGEGWIGMFSRQKKSGGIRYYQGRMTLGMTEPALINAKGPAPIVEGS